MNPVPYLPLGSIVMLEGGIQEVMIISRGIIVRQKGETVFFDYGGVLYPEGLSGDRMGYFNYDAIVKVIFTGYDSENSKTLANNINHYLTANPNIKRGDPTAEIG